jgi:ribosomal 30S subunit maturation factor RimM
MTLSNSEELIAIGCLGSPHGIKGGLRIITHTIPFDIALDHHCLLQQDSKLVELNIEKLEQHHIKNVIYLKEITSRSTAEEMVGASLYYPRLLFFQQFPDQIYGPLCQGYTVLDQNETEIGRLESVDFIDDLPIATINTATHRLKVCVLAKYVMYIDHTQQQLAVKLT